MKKAGNAEYPEATVLITSINDLTPVLASNLTDVANKLVSKFTISSEEHEMIVDPQKGHTQLCLMTILNTIGKAIQREPEKLYEFADMLEKMGSYYRDLYEALSRCIESLQYVHFIH